MYNTIFILNRYLFTLRTEKFQWPQIASKSEFILKNWIFEMDILNPWKKGRFKMFQCYTDTSSYVSEALHTRFHHYHQISKFQNWAHLYSCNPLWFSHDIVGSFLKIHISDTQGNPHSGSLWFFWTRFSELVRLLLIKFRVVHDLSSKYKLRVQYVQEVKSNFL